MTEGLEAHYFITAAYLFAGVGLAGYYLWIWQQHRTLIQYLRDMKEN